MYADMKTGGWRLHPVQDGTYIGMTNIHEDEAVIVVHTHEPYDGVIIPDKPRHELYFNMPRDIPRLNSWPEWVTTADLEQVIMVKEKSQHAIPMDDLNEGMPISLPRFGKIVIRLKLSGNHDN